MRKKLKKKVVTYSERLKKPFPFQLFVFNRNFILWALLGIIGGIIAGLYWIILEWLTHKLSYFTGWAVIPVMALSGLLAGFVIHILGDPGEIHLIVNNIRFKKGKLDSRNNPSMLLSSLLCVASGGSLGPEAPLVQITGSTGTWIGKVLRLKGEDLRSTSIAGMASGFTALFGAPLGGSLFSLEILHHKHALEYYRAIIPALVASCFSYFIFALIVHLGLGPTWILPGYTFENTFDFGLAVLIALVAGLIGWLFIYMIKGINKLLGQVKAPIYVKTGLGGLILGLLAYCFPLTRYFGHEQISELLTINESLDILWALLAVKLLAIAVTVTSGWRGGFIIPLFFVGTVLGLIIHQVFPGINASLAIISSMAAINSCVTRTPISTTILLSTMTGFSYFIPILFASLTGFFIAPRKPFIKSQLEQLKEQ